MFIIQTIDGLIRDQACLEIFNQREEACSLSDILSLPEKMKTDRRHAVPPCPVGSIEFVHAAMAAAGRTPPEPLNIPPQLRTVNFLKRKIRFTDRAGIDPDAESFIKQTDTVKGYTGHTPTIEEIPEGRYYVSELMEIESEWRCFVSDRMIADARRYASPYDAAPPDWKAVTDMVRAFDGAPPAWTLDVGTGPKGTFVIECHHFYSCGLYGCTSHLLPFIYKSWWNWFMKKNPV